MNERKINVNSQNKFPKRLTTFKILISIWSFINPGRRVSLIILMLLSLLSGVAELISFGAVIPFLSVLTDPSYILENQIYTSVVNLFKLDKGINLQITITLIFCLSVLFAALVRLSNIWFNAKVSARIGNDLSVKVYNTIINKPYEFHINKNSSEIINTINKQIPNAVSGINDFLQLITGICVSIFIFSGIIFIDPKIAIFSLVIFGFIYLIISLTARKKLNQNSRIILEANQKQILLVQEAIGSIKEIILGQIQNYFLINYSKKDKVMRTKEAEISFISTFPRFFIEAVGLICIALFSLFFILNKKNNVNIIPVLGSLALGSQRLLPAMQLIYTSWSGLKAKRSSFIDVLNTISSRDNQFFRNKKFNFTNFDELRIDNVNFSYPDSNPKILSNINFSIKRGERIGIVGQTGSGKSTLIDLIIGLLKPTSGKILLDGFDINTKNNQEYLYFWRSLISYVPQSLFLVDKSIAENIAFGISSKDLNMEKLLEVSKKSQIDKFINKLPSKFKTVVGERGINLSGGQVQRIAIARALYKNPKVLVFDEATSALDLETENNLINSIERLDRDLTIIMIAHRTSTLSSCDKIISINDGKLDFIKN